MSSENVKTEAVASEQEAPAAEETKTEETPAEETKTETAETEETNMADAAPKEETVAATEAPAAEEAAPAAEAAPAEEAAAPAAEEAKAEEPAAPAEEPAADAAAPEPATAADEAEAAADDANPPAAEAAEELPPIPEGVMGAQTMVMGDKSAAPPSRLFYMDFLPQMMQAGDKKNKVHPKFEGFKQVFYKINQFLLNNPFKVLSVEQMMLPVDWDGSVKTDDSIFNNKDMGSVNLVCCTRVWLLIKPKSDESAPDSLAYYIHKPMPSGGVSEPEQLLNLPTTIDLLNQEIKKSVIPGRIISVQTMDHQVGPDFSPTQMLSGEFGDDAYLGCSDRCRAVTLIMVIYAQGEPLNQEIGVADFAPDVLKAPSAGKGKVFFTPFNEVLNRATAWITANDAKFLRVTNIQIASTRIVDITPKMAALKKAGGQIDTKAMWHCDSRNFPTSYLKVVRAFYVKIDSPEDREPLALSTKMIVAHKKNQQLGEPVVNVVGRANAWLSVFDKPVYGAQMLSFEYTPASPTVDVEEMCWLADKKIRTFITVVLLFLHGSYEETGPLKKQLPRSMYPVNPVDKSLKLDDKPKSSTCTVL